ncbi:hypothetical protein ACSUZJ_14420 [Telluria sp. B2]
MHEKRVNKAHRRERPSFTYGFLENAGLPRLSTFTVWCVLCGATGLVGVVRRLAGK